MGLFDNIKNKKELERLEKLAKEAPSARNYYALIKKYHEVNDMENGLRIAQKAVDLYPESDEIFDLYARLRKSLAHNEIETLKKSVEQRPSQSAFAQLAEFYKDLREEDAALKYCRQSVELFPNTDSPYLIMGELRLRRFYKDFLAKDGKIAITNLEKAYEINQRNYKALILLSKLYLQIGFISKAADKLAKILRFAPEDGEVKEMIEICKKIPRPSHEDIDLLLQTAEDQRRLYCSLEDEEVDSEPLPLTPEVFQGSLDYLKNVEGINCLLISDEQGNLITHFAKEGFDIELYYPIATAICQTVQDSSRRMDIGRFQRVQLETPSFNINILSSGGVIYSAFGAKEIKADTILRNMQRFISKISLHTKRG